MNIRSIYSLCSINVYKGMEDFNGMKPFTRVETHATYPYSMPCVNMSFYHDDLRTLVVLSGFYNDFKIESLEAPDVWINADGAEEHTRTHGSIDDVIALYEPSLSPDMIEQLKLILPYLRDHAKPHPSWIVEEFWPKSEPKRPEHRNILQWIRSRRGVPGY